MASKRTKKKVSIVEPMRHCIRPKFDFQLTRDRLPAKNFYGQHMSREGMCPLDSPYLGYTDGVYCCQSTMPTPDEAYQYFSEITQNIEKHKPEPEHIEHWSTWSGFPTGQQQEEIASMIDNPLKRRTRKDMRWLKTQFDESGSGARTIQWLEENMRLVGKDASCHILKKLHCNLRRDCLFENNVCGKRSQASIQALQKAEKEITALRRKKCP